MAEARLQKMKEWIGGSLRKSAHNDWTSGGESFSRSLVCLACTLIGIGDDCDVLGNGRAALRTQATRSPVLAIVYTE